MCHLALQSCSSQSSWCRYTGFSNHRSRSITDKCSASSCSNMACPQSRSVSAAAPAAAAANLHAPPDSGVHVMQIAPISSADHQQLQMLSKQQKAEEARYKQQHPTASTQNPVVDWAIWLVKPPSFSSGRVEYIVKRIITAPIR